MEVFIAADHNGFEMKNSLKGFLEEEGYDVTDLGADNFDKDDDYPDFGIKVAEAVAEDPDNRFGIALCGSGVGMSVMAGKIDGVRAGLIHDEEIAKAARHDDNINVLAIGAKYISDDKAKSVVKAWLNEEFSPEERYVRRLDKIKKYEEEN